MIDVNTILSLTYIKEFEMDADDRHPDEDPQYPDLSMNGWYLVKSHDLKFGDISILDDIGIPHYFGTRDDELEWLKEHFTIGFKPEED